ncbi:hypothetical protein EHYA_06044 [Embleya hyalina]|uniref:Uncharacterized protein n=1 Tax=Embleya hyalina TaxID=516124 RepID=A0A401YUM9_9ACTN|nr:hypothetical protein EHYA_06044 [Embleya hyalina]
MSGRARCLAAHPDDSSECDGASDLVRVVDSHGREVRGCIHHASRMLASLDGARVYPGASGGAAIETFNRAQDIQPFAWLTGRG